jgi:hypothetical protein
MNDFPDLDWLVNEIEKLQVRHGVITRARALSENLTTICEQKVIKGSLTLAEFFTLAIAFRFVTDLIMDRHCQPAVDIHARRRQESIPRPTLPSDANDTMVKIIEYWNKNFPILQKLAIEASKNETAEAHEWLDFILKTKDELSIDRHRLIYKVTDKEGIAVTTEHTTGTGSIDLITQKFEQIIRYHEYGLCQKSEIKAKKTLPMTYSLHELTCRWNTNEKNVLAACATNNFWAYINLTTEVHLENFHQSQSFETKIQISDSDADQNYKYPFPNFARLAKRTSVGGGIILEYFYSNKTVIGKKGTLTLVWIDPPLCARVLGIFSQHIEADQDFQPTLYFIRDEIDTFEKTDVFLELFLNNNARNIQRKKGNKNHARNSGKKSGEIRTKDANAKWQSIKPALLNIAQNEPGLNANKIATLAKKRGIIKDHEVSNTAKKIRADKQFTPYISKR